MLIALDYDDTYTRDPKFWLTFIENAHGAGHEVICITMRTPAEGVFIETQFRSMLNATYFTERKAKKPWAKERKIFPDVWIDDEPRWVLEDALPVDSETPAANRIG